ncbi:DUF3995 domain-containing protein [Paenibacillus eucommiae]|uniref:Glucan phosphoethanolaminetransferase (Alkaline phosphatase superfamily) n=1 Tax=Paenibacillus eucommiae TaxID=1355755 RepID=A0ABS4IQ28_9BACL|nr:DUF3995 domain-containing protein [Paenibacillus eucommiae]MBP1989664.1 glucan phosphoethanolaminetransferase (alkaline phosphatase superfamily) [Paenibacillus eucommiae]
MKFVMTLSSVSILALISFLHVYWAYGGHWGIHATIPSKAGEHKPAFVPGKLGTLFVAILMLIVCFILLIQGGYIPFFSASTIIRIGCIVSASVFFLRAIGDFKYVGFFKRINHTVFARNDTWLYSPLCFYFGLTCTILLLSSN